MGIIYIGDRSVGKTHLAMELANSRTEHIKVLNDEYDFLKALLVDPEEDTTKPTEAIGTQDLEIQASLPTGRKRINITWIDTPGEIWRKSWQQDNPEAWKDFLHKIRESEGILLILPPWRELLNPAEDSTSEYPTERQWQKRFERWVDFFEQDCPKARHIVLCLNKADLFQNIDLRREAARLAFSSNGTAMTWQQRHTYIANRYFRPIQPQLDQISRSTTGLSVRCFITSIYNRSLLELPWIYLASFLAN